VERHWSQPTPVPQPNGWGIEFGWDTTHQFYAAATKKDQGDTHIEIVDRLAKRWCSLGVANWTDAGFNGQTYQVRVFNQYGWGSTTSLDLLKWSVTITVTGSCFQWMDCHIVDPPEVDYDEYCDPDKIYEPGGLN